MRSLPFWQKVIRLRHCLAAAVAAWAVALLSNGPFWFSQEKLAAAACAFFSVMGASLYHYGARHDVYEKKYWDPVIVADPHLLTTLGSTAFLFSIGVATFWLPRACVGIALINFFLILLYGRVLDRYFLTKNPVISYLCVTPLLLGFFSGHRLHPVLEPVLGVAFFLYLSREFLKDIEDYDANRRSGRFTVPIVFGRRVTMLLAGVALLAATAFSMWALQCVPRTSVAALLLLIAAVLLAGWGAYLVFFTPSKTIPYAKFKWLDGSSWAMLLALLSLRAGL